MYSMAADFSRAQVRLAVFVTLVETLRILLTVMAVATLALLGVLYFGLPGWPSNIASGMACGLTSWIAMVAVAYYVNLREVRRALRILPTTRVSYQLSEEGCAISSDAWSEFLPWRCFLRLTRYPRVVLLEIIESRSKEELTNSLQARLRAKSGRAAIRWQGRGFPVFWMLPLPLRSFLVIPASGLPVEQIAFIRDRLIAAGRA